MSISLPPERASLNEFCTTSEFARRAKMCRHTLYQWLKDPEKIKKHNLEVQKFGGTMVVRLIPQDTK